MKSLLLIIGLSVFYISHGQKWSSLPGTLIEKMEPLGVNNHDVTLFKKGLSVIAVNNQFANDFSELFIDDQSCFDPIIKELKKIYVDAVFDDTLSTYFHKNKIDNVVYITKHASSKLKGGRLLWQITNVYGDGEPCFTQIILKRLNRTGSSRMRFISVLEITCQI